MCGQSASSLWEEPGGRPMDRPCPSQQGCTPLPTVSCDLRAQESLCERDLGTSRGAVGLGRKVVGEQRFFPPWRQGSASSLTDPRRKHRGTRLCPSRQRRGGQGRERGRHAGGRALTVCVCVRVLSAARPSVLWGRWSCDGSTPWSPNLGKLFAGPLPAPIRLLVSK